MDTPTIAAYYREHDPIKRKNLLEKSIQEGEDPQENAIRKELWELRYSEKAESGQDARADAFLGLWMTLEFNRDAAKRFFGSKSARKEINKYLTKLKFEEIRGKGELYEELLYRECCHLAKMYMELCETDRTYNSTLCGIMPIKGERAKQKIKLDIYETAVALPPVLKMERELELITKAAKEMYALHFPDEGPIEECRDLN